MELKLIKDQDVLEACLACYAACNQCLTACLQEDAVMMRNCIIACRDCANTCLFVINSVTAGSAYAVLGADLCLQACETCHRICAEHNDDHCRACAEACFHCIEVLRGLMQQA